MEQSNKQCSWCCKKMWQCTSAENPFANIYYEHTTASTGIQQNRTPHLTLSNVIQSAPSSAGSYFSPLSSHYVHASCVYWSGPQRWVEGATYHKGNHSNCVHQYRYFSLCMKLIWNFMHFDLQQGCESVFKHRFITIFFRFMRRFPVFQALSHDSLSGPPCGSSRIKFEKYLLCDFEYF